MSDLTRGRAATCVTCEQMLDGGRCTNPMCPGFVDESEVERLEKERDGAVEAVELLLKGREWPGGFAVIARQARTLAGLSTVTKESHDKKN